MSDIEEMVHNLRFHAGNAAAPIGNHELPRVSSQFRPYKGRVDESTLAGVRDLAEALESISLGDVTARMAGGLAIWVMVTTISSWVLDAGGMLQRNKLIGKQDASTVRQWTHDMSEIGFRLLDQSKSTSRATSDTQISY